MNRLVTFVILALFSLNSYSQELIMNLSLESGQPFPATTISSDQICLIDDANGAQVVSDTPFFTPINNLTVTASGGETASFTALPCAGGSFDYAIVSVTFDGSQPPPPPPPPVSGCGNNTVCIHAFINSLWDHNIGLTPLTSNNPYWLNHLFAADSKTLKASGQFGFMSQHAELPPANQLGYPSVSPAWADGESFAEVGYDHIFIGPANFIQYEGDAEERHSEFDAILSYLNISAPDAEFWIYEGLPDMGGFENNMNSYYSYARGSYHEWFIDHMLTARASGHALKIVPLAAVFANLMQHTIVGSMPLGLLFEDSAPHGTPTAHLLYSMIVYTYITAKKAPEITPSPLIDPILTSNYAEIANFIYRTRVVF